MFLIVLTRKEYDVVQERLRHPLSRFCFLMLMDIILVICQSGVCCFHYCLVLVMDAFKGYQNSFAVNNSKLKYPILSKNVKAMFESGGESNALFQELLPRAGHRIQLDY